MDNKLAAELEAGVTQRQIGVPEIQAAVERKFAEFKRKSGALLGALIVVLLLNVCILFMMTTMERRIEDQVNCFPQILPLTSIYRPVRRRAKIKFQ